MDLTTQTGLRRGIYPGALWHRLVLSALRGRRIKASFSCTESFRPVGDTNLVLKVGFVGRVLRPILLKDTVTDFRNRKV